ncbi:hypothetical protein COO59_11715 [Mixta theicola]|uniref:Uncharacterized protein n=1 Tax=Mixta theicola TaxID=1458355 RepID=A0A2K1Q9F9_9GAMM|nr:hypothetical protein COO59_11715 [Mixta theicola]
MMGYIKKFLRRQGRFFFSMYGPALLTIIFALLQAHYFPGSPVWPTGVLFILIMIIIGRYVKW